MTERFVTFTLNGEQREAKINPRMHLGDFLRHSLGLTGTHIGCEHGVCGACTVIVDGAPVRSCLMLAVQIDGCTVETVESLGKPGELSPLQNLFLFTRSDTIYGGSSEIQRNIIAERLWKLPRDTWSAS